MENEDHARRVLFSILHFSFRILHYQINLNIAVHPD
jgi:hypothetical protein